MIVALSEQEKKRGRPQLISASDCLGLVLAWTNMVLQIIFGMSSTSVLMYLRFGRRILIKVLRNEPNAAIQIPDIDTIRMYQQVIKERHPNLQGVWCTMDGLKFVPTTIWKCLYSKQLL
jgi:hypothetical protein